jgi:hypothetical protein
MICPDIGDVGFELVDEVDFKAFEEMKDFGIRILKIESFDVVDTFIEKDLFLTFMMDYETRLFELLDIFTCWLIMIRLHGHCCLEEFSQVIWQEMKKVAVI